MSDVRENKEIISWEYVKNKLNPNFIEMVKHLYPWQEERFTRLVSGSYIWGLIDDKISSYFWVPKHNFDYRFNCDLSIENLLSTWYMMVKVSWDTKWWVLSAIDWHKYYDDGVTEMFIEQYQVQTKDPSDHTILETKKYVYVQSFSDHILKNKLYEISWTVLSAWQEVSLDTIPELAWRPDEQIIMELDRLVYKIKVESPIIEKIKTIIYSIERKWMEADKQFMNYMDQWTILKNIEIPKNAMKKVTYWWIDYDVTDFDKLWKLLEIDADNWDGSIEIVKNWNDLVEDALKFSERQIRMISAITDVPAIFFWLENEWQGNDSGTTIVKSSWAFYKRIERYRKAFEEVFEDIKKDLKIDYQFDWPSIVTSDPDEVVETEIKKLDAWLTTKVKSIMRIYWIDETEATALNKKIMEEKKAESDLEPKTDPEWNK